MGNILDKELINAGYSILGGKEIEELIISIIESKNERYLKAIPYLIYLHRPDIDQIYSETKNKKLLGELISITRKIFSEEEIRIELPRFDKSTKLNYEEFKQEFNLQKYRKEDKNLIINREKIYAERNLQMWMSQIFTKKEKEIIIKILNDEKLTRTEYEYYSRKTKKKLNAIMNLQDTAKALIPLSPKV